MKFIFDEIKLNNGIVDPELKYEDLQCTVNVNIDKLPIEVKTNYIKYSHACRDGAKVYLELFEHDVIKYVTDTFKIPSEIVYVMITLSGDNDDVKYLDTKAEDDVPDVPVSNNTEHEDVLVE